MVTPGIHAIRNGLKLTSELGHAGIPLRGITGVASRIPYSSSKIRSMSDIYAGKGCVAPQRLSEVERLIDTLVNVVLREEQTSYTLQSRNDNERE
jgi:hypothetical protein